MTTEFTSDSKVSLQIKATVTVRKSESKVSLQNKVMITVRRKSESKASLQNKVIVTVVKNKHLGTLVKSINAPSPPVNGARCIDAN